MLFCFLIYSLKTQNAIHYIYVSRDIHAGISVNTETGISGLMFGLETLHVQVNNYYDDDDEVLYCLTLLTSYNV